MTAVCTASAVSARARQSGRRAIFLALAAGLLAGCSGIRPYPDTPDRNLLIRTDARSGSAFSRVRAAVDIYRVDEQCRADYQGTVELDQPEVSAGIPADRSSYLAFRFSGSGLLGGTSSSISKETLLNPRAGHRYDIDVTYRDDIYNVVIREYPASGGPGRDIEFRNLRDCGRRVSSQGRNDAILSGHQSAFLKN